MTISILISRGVHKEFWLEAILWIFHVLNKCPTYIVRNKTLEEDWSGKKPFVDYFSIFGCIAFAYVPAKDRSENCVFLGISDE